MNTEQILYGIHPVSELLQTRISSIDHIFIDKDKKSSALFELMKICRKERLDYHLVPEMRLRQLAGSANHQGIIAQCSVIPYCSAEELREKLQGIISPLLVLPASIEDTGNLGAVIRSAVALGANGLLLERKHTAPLNAAVAKSSAGMIEHLPIARPKNLEGLITSFIEAGYAVLGAEMLRGKHPQEVDCTGPTILVLGGEHRGIPPYLSRLCTGFLSIPMSSSAHSLNVSVTGAILLYEVSRQRLPQRQLP